MPRTLTAVLVGAGLASLVWFSCYATTPSAALQQRLLVLQDSTAKLEATLQGLSATLDTLGTLRELTATQVKSAQARAQRVAEQANAQSAASRAVAADATVTADSLRGTLVRQVAVTDSMVETLDSLTAAHATQDSTEAAERAVLYRALAGHAAKDSVQTRTIATLTAANRPCRILSRWRCPTPTEWVVLGAVGYALGNRAIRARH